MWPCNYLGIFHFGNVVSIHCQPIRWKYIISNVVLVEAFHSEADENRIQATMTSVATDLSIAPIRWYTARTREEPWTKDNIGSIWTERRGEYQAIHELHVLFWTTIVFWAPVSYLTENSMTVKLPWEGLSMQPEKLVDCETFTNRLRYYHYNIHNKDETWLMRTTIR